MSKNLGICKYSWQKLSNNCTNKLTRYVLQRKAIATSLQLREANDSFGKGFHMLKPHVLNHLLTGWSPRKSLQLRPKFHSHILQNNFDFRKSATFKGLKSSPRLY